MQTEPTGLDAISAATVTAPSSTMEAEPRPPFSAPARAPRPAPTEPRGKSSAAARSAARASSGWGGPSAAKAAALCGPRS